MWDIFESIFCLIETYLFIPYHRSCDCKEYPTFFASPILLHSLNSIYQFYEFFIQFPKKKNSRSRRNVCIFSSNTSIMLFIVLSNSKYFLLFFWIFSGYWNSFFPPVRKANECSMPRCHRRKNWKQHFLIKKITFFTQCKTNRKTHRFFVQQDFFNGKSQYISYFSYNERKELFKWNFLRFLIWYLLGISKKKPYTASK